MAQLVDPGFGSKRPAGHAWHSDTLAVGWKCPAAHTTHELDLVANWWRPASQMEHTLALVLGWNLPAAHAEQVVWSCVPTTSWKWPGVQSLQLLAP